MQLDTRAWCIAQKNMWTFPFPSLAIKCAPANCNSDVSKLVCMDLSMDHISKPTAVSTINIEREKCGCWTQVLLLLADAPILFLLLKFVHMSHHPASLLFGSSHVITCVHFLNTSFDDLITNFHCLSVSSRRDSAHFVRPSWSSGYVNCPPRICQLSC